MNNLILIIKREFIARVRNKAFILMTFLSPFIFVIMMGFVVWLISLKQSTQQKIAISDQSNLFASNLKDSSNIDFINYGVLTIEEAKSKAIKEQVNGLLYVQDNDSTDQTNPLITYYVSESPNMLVIFTIENVINTTLTRLNYQTLGIDFNTLQKAKTNVNVKIEKFTGEQTTKNSNFVKMIFGGASGYFLMMFIIIYGNMVMRSVIEEKTNRIVEIIISSVPPIKLMMGKILGTTLAGMLQFIVWSILGVILFITLISIFGMSELPFQVANSIEVEQFVGDREIAGILTEMLNLPIFSMMIYFAVYFIGGYFLYSSIYSAIGAAVDSETDSQQFMIPVILPLMMSMYIGFFIVVENPHGTIATIFSMIPMTSPIIMLIRIPFGVPWWQIFISIVLLFGCIILYVWIAAKIYKIGILMYGKKPSYREIMKWLKY